ncbi:MAG: hypothetical protein A2202_00260 [Bdellovibrionales bacterium RIFOXYA1_FULL_36_14]|nr:MAG: hypothetical protein A2202_00260 [Bdellovibrionales bacterium RIFOXYA1_FULL_36_14]
MSIYKKQFYMLLILIIITFWGCSNYPTIVEFPATANSADEVQKFSSDMQSALDRQIDVLSPTSYEKAQDALDDALSAQERGKDPEVILHAVAVGRAQLNEANKFAQISHVNMEDVVIARQAALTAGANKLFPDDFKKADENLRAVTTDVEENKLGVIAENRPILQQEYRDVELKAIKKNNLGPAHEAIALAIKEGASTYAKQSLAIAELAVNNADAFITAYRNNTYAIQARSADALEKANHLVKITRSSKAGNKITSEESALMIEKEQIKTQDKRDELAMERSKSQDMAVETRYLKSDKEYNQSFETARAQFEKNEAEVYRQGNQLVIRIRSLNFPVNRSHLRGENYPVLGKVANVIKGFNNPTVVVEGHTDSDGSKEQNDRLSVERSQTVSNYLISSGVIESEKISTVGLGSKRPLASNKTAEGKAQNRRVDIVIDL